MEGSSIKCNLSNIVYLINNYQDAEWYDDKEEEVDESRDVEGIKEIVHVAMYL